MRISILGLVGAIFVAACSSAPSSNAMTVDRDGNSFTGRAGSDWSDQELRSNAFGALCAQGESVANLQIQRDSGGVATFSGTCVK